jgi:hypothetical protein
LKLDPNSYKILFEYLNESKIVNDTKDFLNSIEFNNFDTNNFKLLYRASRDGFSAESFHLRVKNRQKTLALIKSGTNVFGGYTDLSWNGDGSYKYDSNAFLFSYLNPNKASKIFKLSSSSYYSNAIYDASDILFRFGNNDLQVCSNANKNTCSSSYLGSMYQMSSNSYGYYNSYNNYFTGSNNFMIDEIELYQILN